MSVPTLHRLVQGIWYRERGCAAVAATALSPLAKLYGGVASCQHRRDRVQCTAVEGVQVVVVGNIAVGGTGKTPLLIALAPALQQRGHRVGIVSRGYGGTHDRRNTSPQRVPADGSVSEYGDEPVLLAASTSCPVVVCRDRSQAVRYLAEHCGCTLVLSDDGLQHYRMHRDVELVVVDAQRGFGNGRLLPAGPLREPIARLATADALVFNETAFNETAFKSTLAGRGCETRDTPLPPGIAQFRFALQARALRRLDVSAGVDASGASQLPVDSLSGQAVHAVAGIGNPARFFASLRELGMDVREHAFPDHHPFVAGDLDFGDGLPIVMTAKDAVKCLSLPMPAGVPVYCLDVDARIDVSLVDFVEQRLLASSVHASP